MMEYIEVGSNGLLQSLHTYQEGSKLGASASILVTEEDELVIAFVFRILLLLLLDIIFSKGGIVNIFYYILYYILY